MARFSDLRTGWRRSACVVGVPQQGPRAHMRKYQGRSLDTAIIPCVPTWAVAVEQRCLRSQMLPCSMSQSVVTVARDERYLTPVVHCLGRDSHSTACREASYSLDRGYEPVAGEGDGSCSIRCREAFPLRLHTPTRSLPECIFNSDRDGPDDGSLDSNAPDGRAESGRDALEATPGSLCFRTGVESIAGSLRDFCAGHTRERYGFWSERWGVYVFGDVSSRSLEASELLRCAYIARMWRFRWRCS
jgi:hypothetical protein